MICLFLYFWAAFTVWLLLPVILVLEEGGMPPEAAPWVHNILALGWPLLPVVLAAVKLLFPKRKRGDRCQKS